MATTDDLQKSSLYLGARNGVFYVFFKVILSIMIKKTCGPVKNHGGLVWQ